MASLDSVDASIGDVPFMTLDQARIIERLLADAPTGDLLELGFAHGKGSAYLGALASQRGSKVVCVDRPSARRRQPSPDDTIAKAAVADYVEFVYEEMGYNWWLKKQLELSNEPRFALVYLDGAHEWSTDALAFKLFSDLVLPGGVLIVDDLDWSFATSPSMREKSKKLPTDYATSAHVRKVWDLLVLPDPTWHEFEEIGQWGIARKRVADSARSVERVVIRKTASPISVRVRRAAVTARARARRMRS